MSPPVSETVEAGILMKVVNEKMSQREAMKKLKISRRTLLIKLEKFRSEYKEECFSKISVKWEDLNFAKRDDITRRYLSGEITSSKAASELGVNCRTFRRRVSVIKEESAEVHIRGEIENQAGIIKSSETKGEATCHLSVVEGTKGEELQTLGDVYRHRPVETTLTPRHIQEREVQRENQAGLAYTGAEEVTSSSSSEGAKVGDLQTLVDVDQHRGVVTTLTPRHIQEREAIAVEVQRQNQAGLAYTGAEEVTSSSEGAKVGDLQTLVDVDRHRVVVTTLTPRHIQEREAIAVEAVGDSPGVEYMDATSMGPIIGNELQSSVGVSSASVGLRAILHSERVNVTPMASTAGIDLELSDRVSSPMFSPASPLAVGNSPGVEGMDVTPMGPIIGNELQSSVGVSSAVFSPCSLSASWIDDHRVCSGVVSDDSAIHDRTSTCFAIPRRRAAKKRLVLLSTPDLDVAENQLTASNSDGARGSDQEVVPSKRRCFIGTQPFAESSDLFSSTPLKRVSPLKRRCRILQSGCATSSDSALENSSSFTEKSGNSSRIRTFISSSEKRSQKRKYKRVHSSEIAKKKKIVDRLRGSVQKRKKINHYRNHPSAKKRQMVRYHGRHSSEKKRSKDLYKERHPSAKKRFRSRRLFFLPSRYRVQRHRMLRPELQCRREALRRILYRKRQSLVVKLVSEEQLQKALILSIHHRNSRKRKIAHAGEKLTVVCLRSELVRLKLLPNEEDRNKILSCFLKDSVQQKMLFPKKGGIIKGSVEWQRNKEWQERNWAVNSFAKDLLKRDPKKNLVSAKREVGLTLRRVKKEREEAVRCFYKAVNVVQKKYQMVQSIRLSPAYIATNAVDRELLLLDEYLGERIHVRSQEPSGVDTSKFEWFPIEEVRKPTSVQLNVDCDESMEAENCNNVFKEVNIGGDENEIGIELDKSLTVVNRGQCEDPAGTNVGESSAVLDIYPNGNLAGTEVDAGDKVVENYIKDKPTGQEEEAVKPTYARKCHCAIASDVAIHIDNNLKGCDSGLNFKELQLYFLMLEHCESCEHLEYPSCPLGELCGDFFKFLRSMSSHGATLRTLLRNLYTCRQLNDWLMNLDSAFWSSDYELLCSLLPSSTEKDEGVLPVVNLNTEVNMLSEVWLNKRYERQLNAFQSEIDSFIARAKLFCDICNLNGTGRFREFKNWNEFKEQPECNNGTLKRIKQFYSTTESVTDSENESLDSGDEEVILPSGNKKILVCGTCFASIKQNKIPLKSEINGFHYKDLPKEISDLNLNFYERLLIQRSRCFQTIIQLKPYTSVQHGAFVRALKGLVVHLPLNTDSTVNYSLKQLPSFDLLQIFVHSLPTSQRVVWKNLVDLKKVTAAIQCFKKINDEYKDVQVMHIKDGPVTSESVVFVPETDENVSNVRELDPENIVEGGNKTVLIQQVVKGNDVKEQNQAGLMNSVSAELTDQIVDEGNNQAGLEGDSDIQLLQTSVVESENQAGLKDGIDTQLVRPSVRESENPAGIQESDIQLLQTSVVESEDPAGLKDGIDTQLVQPSVGESENPTGIQEESEMQKLIRLDAELAEKSELKYMINAKELEGQYTVVSVQNPISKLTDVELFQQKRVSGSIIPIDDKKVDLHAFPMLYPYGKNGMYEDREVKVGPSMFPKIVLNLKKPCFRRDVAYLFFLYHALEHRALDHGIFACLHAKLHKGLTADQFRSLLSEEQSKILEANLSMMFTQKRGIKEYWSRVGGDLHAIDIERGPAHWFVTLSCAEFHWEDLNEYLNVVNKDIPGFSNMQQAKMCVDDPVSVAKFFYWRFKKFFETLIMDKHGPFGVVVDYFWRIEYQARGAPHVHMKLWVKDAPLIGKDSDEKVQEYILNTVTCHMPDPKLSPQLFELVSKYQTHRCTNSCRRFRKVKNYGLIRRCRYSFPRRVTTAFKFHTTKETVQSRQGGNRIERLYDLPRKDHERMINDYNSILLLAWKANVDVQYIGDNSYVVSKYITSYMTKHEKKATAAMWEALSKLKVNASIASRLRSYGLQRLKDREAGSYEVAHLLLGQSLYETSSHVKYINVNFKKDRRRRLRSKQELADLSGDSMDLYSTNMIDDYYPNRSDELEESSLHDIVANYEYRKQAASKKARTKSFPLKKDLGLFKKRLHPAVVKIPRFSTKSDDQQERYFHGLLLLLKPWRQEEEVLDGCVTFRAAYEKAKDSFKELESFHAVRERLENADRLIEQFKKDVVEENVVEKIDTEDPGFLLDEEGVTNSIHIADADKLEAMISNLNDGQRNVFNTVVAHIHHQELHRKGECDCDTAPENLVGLVSGVGGCGKSFLIDVLALYLRSLYSVDSSEESVHITAPTGLAAFNIHGVTLHKKLKLPVQHGADQLFYDLGRDDQKQLTAALRNMRLLIIDEFSMVSNVLLISIHKRLVQAFGSDDDFGGTNVLLFGDPLQLRPVRADFCFERLKQKDMIEHFSSVGIAPMLLANVRYFELLENMRQKGDDTFVGMLTRIRVGSPTSDDIKALETRLLSNCLPYFNENEVGVETPENVVDDLNSNCFLGLSEYPAGVKKVMKDRSENQVGIEVPYSLESRRGLRKNQAGVRMEENLSGGVVSSENPAGINMDGNLEDKSDSKENEVGFGMAAHVGSKLVCNSISGLSEDPAGIKVMDSLEGAVGLKENQTGIKVNKRQPQATELFSNLLKKDPRAVCLMPKNNMVDAFNAAMVKQEGIEIVVVTAEDSNTGRNVESQKRRRKKVANAEKTKKVSDTGGLEEELVIGVRARVMLRRNISLESGLVNGAIGIVTSIASPTSNPPSISVLFEGHDSPTDIKRVSVDFEISRGVIMTRRQFPLCLGYALTIHKSQGLTLQSVLADLGHDVFENGMAYVALSRVKSLSGIYLLRLDPSRLLCERIAAEQYSRWRLKAGITASIGSINNLPSSYQNTRGVEMAFAGFGTAVKALRETHSAVTSSTNLDYISGPIMLIEVYIV